MIEVGVRASLAGGRAGWMRGERDLTGQLLLLDWQSDWCQEETISLVSGCHAGYQAHMMGF